MREAMIGLLKGWDKVYARVTIWFLFSITSLEGTYPTGLCMQMKCVMRKMRSVI